MPFADTTLFGRGLAAVRRRINHQGEVFSTTLTFVASSAIRLVSSLVLTRLLYPEAYGVIAILMSVLYVIEMLSDIGVMGLTVRHERGDDPAFLNTLWTLRVIRCAINAAVMLAVAPWVAQWLGSPELTTPLRVCALYFLANAMESMGFALAVRHQRSRVVSYINLVGSLVATVFCIVYSYYSRDHWGMVWSSILERVIAAVASHFVYKNYRPRFHWDRNAVREAFGFVRVVMPTSFITMILMQYERFALLKLADLRAVGLYGVGASVGGPAESLGLRISQMVLYPRFAHGHRTAPDELRRNYYETNKHPLWLIALMPAAVGGAGQHIVKLLYDDRYLSAGFVVQCLMLRAILAAWLRPGEQLLTAVGMVHVQLVANVLRLPCLVLGTLLGFHLAGFKGFVVAIAVEPVLAVAYVLWRQFAQGLGDARAELQRAAAVVLVWLLAFAVASVIEQIYTWVR